MNGPDPAILQISVCEQTDADAVRLAPAREPTSIVYFASAEEVSEGFTIALRAMGFAEVLLPDILRPDTASNPEDG